MPEVDKRHGMFTGADLNSPDQVEPLGRFSVVSDPHGDVFTLITLTPA